MSDSQQGNSVEKLVYIGFLSCGDQELQDKGQESQRANSETPKAQGRRLESHRGKEIKHDG